MAELVSAGGQKCGPTRFLNMDLVIGDNESQIMKMISQLPKETGSV